ncbi:hypothetical protein FRX31_002991 [Thalictrum thalictroides]|uniref:3'-5' exonuclease domain-containing protein n=1 Tax=Thalictrum thalictroides TaxID=46969 RepID=A0A7J6XD67_THATH|nr:hypothetical protein FRX31_002991 [Thalictrum thalictroides]
MDYIPQTLKDLISDPNGLVAVVNCNDSRYSRKSYLDCSRAIEVLELAPSSYSSKIYYQIGLKSENVLKDLAKNIEGLNIEKPRFVETSDWKARVLIVEQIRYACLDAYATYRIAHKLLRMNA